MVLVVLLESGADSIELCDLQVGLAVAPVAVPSNNTDNGGSGSELSGGAIAGIVVGSVAGVAALGLLAAYGVKRRRTRQAAQQQQQQAAKDWVGEVAEQGGADASTHSKGGGVGPAAAGALIGGEALALAGSASGGSSSTRGYGSPSSTHLGTPLALRDPLASARASGGSSTTVAEGATDLSKLPPGFIDGEPAVASRQGC